MKRRYQHECRSKSPVSAAQSAVKAASANTNGKHSRARGTCAPPGSLAAQGNAMDAQLYDYARGVFDARVEQMNQDAGHWLAV